MRALAGDRRAAVLLAIVLCALPTTAAGASAEPSPTATAHESASPTRTDEGLAVDLVGMSPAIAVPGQPVDIEASLTNTSGELLTGVEVALRMQTSPPISRTALHGWLDSATAWQTSEVSPPQTLGPIAAGETGTVRLRIDGASIPAADARTWGPHGLEIAARVSGEATDRGATSAAGTLRTWLVTDAPEDTVPMPYAAVVPLTPDVAELEAALEEPAPADALALAAAPRAARDAAALTLPGVTLAVDSLLLAPAPEPAPAPPTEPAPPEAPAGGDQAAEGQPVEGQPAEQQPAQEQPAEGDLAEEPPPAPAPDEPATSPAPIPDIPEVPTAADAPGAAAALRDALAAAPGPDSGLVLLPRADPDVAALSRPRTSPGATAPTSVAAADPADPTSLRASVDAAGALAHAHGLDAETDILLAPGTVLDARTIDTARSAGLTRVAGPGALAPALAPTAWTPSGRAALPTEDGESRALLGDTDLTRIVSGSLPVGPQPGVAGTLDPLEARQLALAETAVIQRERPNDPRVVAVVVDRATVDDAHLPHLAATLGALAQADWLDPMPLGEALALPDGDVDRTAPPTASATATELEPATLTDLELQLDRISSLAASSSDPEALVRPARERIAMLTSAAWRAEPAARDSAVRSVRTALRSLPGQVTVAPSSTINLLATTAELPVRVTNALPVAVSAVVSLDPPDARLTAPEPVTLTVPAHGEATALVPVEAHGSGNLELGTVLTTRDGLPLGSSEVIDVRLRAEWEGRGAAIGGVVLGAVLLVGIVRTVRRRRRRAETDPAASAG